MNLNDKDDLILFYSKLDYEIDVLLSSIENLNCTKGCSQCCIDNLTVFEIEAANIKNNCDNFIKNFTRAEKGKCAFLSEEGECRIYNYRPYVCRTQGLPLRWFDELEDGTPVEYRDICPLNENESLLNSTDTHKFWTIGKYEEELRELQFKKYGNYNRVKLRDLTK